MNKPTTETKGEKTNLINNKTRSVKLLIY